MPTIPLTRRGADLLKTELHRLKTVERQAVIRAIADARAQGDLSENAEYDAAKDKQGFIEGRIAELESKLSRAEIIDPTKHKGNKAVLGATLLVVDCDTDKEHTYALVGPDEANLEKGLLSTSSPIGRALLGKAVGDEAVFAAPSGKKTYEVLKVEFKPIAV